jgi:hypothetical protein
MPMLDAIVQKMVEIKKKDEAKKKERRAIVNRSMEQGSNGGFKTFESIKM